MVAGVCGGIADYLYRQHYCNTYMNKIINSYCPGLILHLIFTFIMPNPEGKDEIINEENNINEK